MLFAFTQVPFEFELAVAGGPVVIGFPVFDGVLAVASIPADPGVPFLQLALPTGLLLRQITTLSN